MISPYRFAVSEYKPSFKIKVKCFFGFHDDGEHLDDVQYKMKSGDSFEPLKCTHICFHCKKLIWFPCFMDEYLDHLSWEYYNMVTRLSKLDEPMSPGPVKKWQ